MMVTRNKEAEKEFEKLANNAMKVLWKYFDDKKLKTDKTKMAKKAVDDLISAYAGMHGLYEWLSYVAQIENKEILKNKTKETEEA